MARSYAITSQSPVNCPRMAQPREPHRVPHRWFDHAPRRFAHRQAGYPRRIAVWWRL